MVGATWFAVIGVVLICGLPRHIIESLDGVDYKRYVDRGDAKGESPLDGTRVAAICA